MAEKDKKDIAPSDDIVPPSAKPKKVAPPQDPQDDDDEQKEEERRLRQEKVKKRKEEMRKKAEQRRKQEQEEDEDEEEDQTPSKAPKSKAAAKQPIRENVVNNGVMFLNHPKVKSAPMSQKIAYLQKKGLTQEEIQEAVERAGESLPSSNTGYAQTAPAPSQAYNPSIPPRPNNYYGAQATPQGYPPQPYPQQQLIPAPPPQQSWYGGKLGLAITVASCVGIGMGFSYIAKNYISPWLFSKEKDNETKQREEYQTKVFEEMLQSLKSMQQSNTELKDYMKTQGELKDLVKTALDRPAVPANPQNTERMKIAELEAELKKMKAQMVDAKSLQSAASTSSYQTWNPTESKIPAWQRSVSASSTPPVNTNVSSTPTVDSFKSPSKDTIPVTSSPNSSPSSPDPVPQNYAQILEMVKNGQLPDDIKDIDDKPREPFTPIEKGERESRPKPWQKKAATTESAPASPSPAPANTEQANGHSQTETKPATSETKPAEEVVS